MPKIRSPVLGFNHNIRHRRWLFHVQTEDSGVSSPHIFTHLFHGGVILTTKKMVYDAESDVDVVRGLMQAQHKSVLKELKAGAFDAKIDKYLANTPPDPDGDAHAAPMPELGDDVTGLSVVTPPVKVQEPPPPVVVAEPPPPEPVPPVAGSIPPAPTSPADDGAWVVREPALASPPPASTVWITKPGSQEKPLERSGKLASVQGLPSAPPPAAPASTAQRARAAVAASAAANRTVPPPSIAVKPAEPNVIVSRPSVVVGGTAAGSATAAPPATAAPGLGGAPPENIFGGDQISEKSLDEVILAYLSDDTSE